MVLIPIIFLCSVIAFFQVKKIVETSIENELFSSTDLLSGLIRTAAQVSIKNRLRAIAEKNLDIAAFFYGEYESGRLSREAAITRIGQVLLSQTIGKSGYIYCIDSQARVLVHPDGGVRGADVSGFGFVRDQLRMKRGYIEYDWKNPGEEKERPKALYMEYFQPLDWIISVSSYREEFGHLVDIADLRQSISSFTIGKSGYAYVINQAGDVLVHPKIKGMNVLKQVENPNDFIKQMLKEKNGITRYFWKNPGEARAREKIVTYKFIPEYGWIIACSSYVDEVFASLTTLKVLLLGVTVTFFLISVGAAFLISRYFTRPLEVLMEKLEQGAQGNYEVRMTTGSPDEFGRLARHFNSFMAQLENSRTVIEEQNKKNIEVRNALMKNDLKLRSLFNQSFQYTGILSPTGILEEINQSGLDYAGTGIEAVSFKPFWELPWWRHSNEVRQVVKESVAKAAQGQFTRFETTSISKKDEIRFIDISIKPVFNSAGEVAFIITEGRDITEYKLAAKERKNLAVQMEKAQKMESIGTLAGGIAHDFNNILSGILGYAQLAELNIGQPLKAKGHIAQILKGARRAARLTQQILTFSRQHEYEKLPLELSLILKEVLKLLRSSIPVTIEIVEKIESRKMVFADPTQMHQVIMNLCTNAYHAMEEGKGRLTVSLREKKISRRFDFFDQVMAEGTYLEMAISDTGTGMDKDVMLKAFDPYFTTKEVGKGTGFGLALVHAIIDEHDGYITLDTEPDKGTTFYIYLPVAGLPDAWLTGEKIKSPIDRGTERIMVVDDEADIREIIKEFLESCGYVVDTFKDGSDALVAFESKPDQYDLILTDMAMPNMTGDILARHVLGIRKDIPVILCTGYSERVTESYALEIGIKRYAQKPLASEDLSAMIREVLDSAKKNQ